MRSSALRVKIKSLAAEAAIIRMEEMRLTGVAAPNVVKTPGGSANTENVVGGDGKQVKVTRVGGSIRWMREHQVGAGLIEATEQEYRDLHSHRVVAVRNEARAALLAYGFLRGKPYARIEGPTTRPLAKTLPPKVIGLVERFGKVRHATAEREVTAWIAGVAAPVEPERVTL